MDALWVLAPICCGFALDLLLGDPPSWPHLVVLLGRIITSLEAVLRRIFPASAAGELAAGAVLALVLPLLSFGAVWGLLALAGFLHPLLHLALASLFCWQCLALRSLGQAGSAVQQALEQGNIAEARVAVGRVVGRDTASLDEAGIIRATVETVSENTVDGVLAPLLYLFLGGAPLGVAYKAINTMDSMVGYRNRRYNYFGRFPARLDDVANFLPARLGGLLMVVAAQFAGLNIKRAWRVFFRDRLRHNSPNSAHTESACAGALGISLGGGAYYGGQYVEKPRIGDAERQPRVSDINSSIKLAYITCIICLLFCVIAKGVFACS